MARPSAVIVAELAPILSDTRLANCEGWLADAKLRGTCIKHVEPRRKELAVAQARERLASEMARASSALAGGDVGRPASADAHALARLLGRLGWAVSAEAIVDVLLVVLVLATELVGGVALALLKQGDAQRSSVQRGLSIGAQSIGTHASVQSSAQASNVQPISVHPLSVQSSVQPLNSPLERSMAPNASTVQPVERSIGPLNAFKLNARADKRRAQMERAKFGIVQLLSAGKLPSAQRAMATAVGVSAGTLNVALRELAAEGRIRMLTGAGGTRIEPVGASRTSEASAVRL